MSREICSICGGSGEVWRLCGDRDSAADRLEACICMTGFELRRSRDSGNSKRALELAVAAIEKAFERQRSKTK